MRRVVLMVGLVVACVGCSSSDKSKQYATEIRDRLDQLSNASQVRIVRTTPDETSRFDFVKPDQAYVTTEAKNNHYESYYCGPKTALRLDTDPQWHFSRLSPEVDRVAPLGMQPQLYELRTLTDVGKDHDGYHSRVKGHPATITFPDSDTLEVSVSQLDGVDTTIRVERRSDIHITIPAELFDLCDRSSHRDE
jgi:hypothetical protein